MTRRATILLVAAVMAFSAALASAQSAEKIVERHIKAIGGEKALRKVTSLRLVGTASGPNGQSSRPFVWQTMKPDHFYVELQTVDGPSIEAYNGRSAWREDPAGGLHSVTGRAQARARVAAIARNDRFLNYKKEKTRLLLAGQALVDGRAAQVVETTSSTGVQRKLFFDAATSLLLKEEQEEENGRAEVVFRDYRPVDGVLEPHGMTIVSGTQRWEVEIREAAHNAPIDPAVFDFPRRAGTSVENVVALLKEMEANQKKIDEVRENYTYTMKENEYEIDDKGRIKPKEERTYEVFYLGDWPVRKLVAKGGHALNASEQKKEQERIEKIIKQYEEDKKKTEAKEAARRQRPGKGPPRKEEDGDDMSVSDFLRVMQLVNPRRERFRGQDVVVFEIDPRPGYKARNRAESLLQKMVGTIWVDEKERQIVRLEARLSDNFRMGGGMVASLHRGSALVFEQDRINDEVWLPRYTEVNLSARVFLVAGFKINRIQQFSDYKKFRVDATSEIAPPKNPPL